MKPKIICHIMSSVDGRLLDELGLVVYPREGQRLQLLSVEQREHGIVWLRYEFHKN